MDPVIRVVIEVFPNGRVSVDWPEDKGWMSLQLLENARQVITEQHSHLEKRAIIAKRKARPPIGQEDANHAAQERVE